LPTKDLRKRRKEKEWIFILQKKGDTNARYTRKTNQQQLNCTHESKCNNDVTLSSNRNVVIRNGYCKCGSLIFQNIANNSFQWVYNFANYSR
jgi:hypothetical protein